MIHMICLGNKIYIRFYEEFKRQQRFEDKENYIWTVRITQFMQDREKQWSN